VSGTQAHLTGALRDLARITISGDDNPSAREGTLEGSAWLVYESVKERAERNDSDLREHEGFMGYVWLGYMKDVFTDLWPTGQSPLAGVEDFDEARNKVTTYLKNSGNLVCIRRGERSPAAGKRVYLPSEWWVRAKFAEVHVSQVKKTAATPEQPPLMLPKDPDPLPAITTEGPGPFVCREPGCGISLPTPTARRSHELDEHATSPNRKWHCFIPMEGVEGGTCPESFYDMGGLGVHMARYHRVRKGTDQYDAPMDRAIARAQELGEELSAKTAQHVLRSAPPVVKIPPQTEGPVVPVSQRVHPQTSPVLKVPPVPVVPAPVPPAPIISSVVTPRAALDMLAAVVGENEELREKVRKLEAELARAKSGEGLRAKLENLLKEIG
jgi:hypothetical protein